MSQKIDNIKQGFDVNIEGEAWKLLQRRDVNEGKWGVKTFLRNRCKCLESFRRSNLFITCLCFYYFWPEQCPTWKRLVLWTLHTYFYNLVWLKQSLGFSCFCHINRIIICQNWIVWINENWIELKNVPKQSCVDNTLDHGNP